MNKIIYRKLLLDEINTHLLDGFVRHQVIDKILFNENGNLVEKDNHWVEDWDQTRLMEISGNIHDIVRKGGICVAAYDVKQIIGMAVLVNELFFDEYMNLDLIHVSFDYRGKGIGKELFRRIEEEARILGARKLYISGHPSVETQAFYKNQGCVLAKKIHQGLFEHEPYDIHLEKVL